jgi:hypothetical protein
VTYIKSEVELLLRKKPVLQARAPGLKDEIINTLSKNAGGLNRPSPLRNRLLNCV